MTVNDVYLDQVINSQQWSGHVAEYIAVSAMNTLAWSDWGLFFIASKNKRSSDLFRQPLTNLVNIVYSRRMRALRWIHVNTPS